jgi:hypothetical protein
MDNPILAHLAVRIKLLTTARGGRSESIPEGEYRGILSARGQHFSFRCDMPAGGMVLGHTANLNIEFLFPELALPFLKEQSEFNLWEGGTIGYGRVLRVLGSMQAK